MNSKTKTSLGVSFWFTLHPHFLFFLHIPSVSQPQIATLPINPTLLSLTHCGSHTHANFSLSLISLFSLHLHRCHCRFSARPCTQFLSPSLLSLSTAISRRNASISRSFIARIRIWYLVQDYSCWTSVVEKCIL